MNKIFLLPLLLLALGVFFLLSLLVLPLLRQTQTAEVPDHAGQLRHLPH